MEFIISADKMKQLMETCDDTFKTFVSTPRDKELVETIKIIKEKMKKLPFRFFH